MKINTRSEITIYGKLGWLKLTDDGAEIKVEAGYSDYREIAKGQMIIERKDIGQVINALQAISNKVNK